MSVQPAPNDSEGKQHLTTKIKEKQIRKKKGKKDKREIY